MRQDPEGAVAELLKRNCDVFEKIINHSFPRKLGDGTASLDGFRYYMIQDMKYLETCAQLKMIAVGESPDFKDVTGFFPRHKKSLEYVDNLKTICITKLGVPASIIEATPRSDELKTSERFYKLALHDRHEEALFGYYIVLLPCVLSYWKIANRLMRATSTVKNVVYHTTWTEENDDDSSVVKYTKFIDENIAAKGGVDQWNHIFNIACMLEAQLFNTGLQHHTVFRIIPEGTYFVYNSSRDRMVLANQKADGSLQSPLDGSSVVGIDKTGGDNEKWLIDATKDGYTFQNMGTHLYLGVSSQEGRILQAVSKPYFWWINPVSSQPNQGSLLYQIHDSVNLRYTLRADTKVLDNLGSARLPINFHDSESEESPSVVPCQMWSFDQLATHPPRKHPLPDHTIMSFVDDKFLPSGNYAIINIGHNQPICFNEENECLSTSNTEYAWTISLLANKKWTIQGPSEVFVDLSPDAVDGDEVGAVKTPPKPHQWVIKRHSSDTQAYIIYSPSQPQLFWSLPHGNEGAIPQLSTDHDSKLSLWKFKRIERQTTDNGIPDPIKQFSTAPVLRPTQLDSGIKNTFLIAIPAGWLTTITSISCGNCVNLIRIRRLVNGALEKQDFVSGWDARDEAMMVDGSDSRSLAFPSAEDAYVFVVETYHSTNRARKDPRRLPGLKDLSTSLRVVTTSRPNDMKSVPDFQAFTIFDESLDASGQGWTQNAIVTIHASIKVAVDLNNPRKPNPGTVNEGYNEELDRPRPDHMDQLLEKYHPVFVVDDSSSMTMNGAWAKAKDALFRIATEVMQYDTGGIDVYFLNSLLHRDAITAPGDIVQIFGQIKPQGPSPIGARLQYVLNEIIEQLERAKSNASDYGKIKPVNIIVLTNSPPSDNPMKVIQSAAKKLHRGLHHPNAVSIQFAQLGNDTSTGKALKKLAEDPSLNMVDIVDSGTKFTPENLQRGILGGLHPSIRADIASSSGLQCLYYRIFDKDKPIVTKRPAYLDDSYLGRIRSKWVTPPYNAGSLRLCLSSMENIDQSKTKLFATLSSSSALVDGEPISFEVGDALGISPEEPLVLFSEAIPKDGLKPGTESLRIPPDPKSQIMPRVFYYGIYTESGVSASKVPINQKEVWISRLDFNLIPPPHSVASLVHLISQKEAIKGPSQLFVSKDATAPLSNDHILTDGDGWPGSTVEDHVLFRTLTDSSPQKCTGFPTGRFRIRASGSPHYYWTSRWYEAAEGNFLVLWSGFNKYSSVFHYNSQIFFVNSAGHLCIEGGLELDISGSSIILTGERQRMEPWPNPWSHPLPTFLYAAESKTITVKFYCDPLVSDKWPRPEREWKDKEFAVAATTVVSPQGLRFEEIARWAPVNALSTRKWSNHYVGFGPHNHCSVGVEEKAGDLYRMAWELEPI
ncbi:hypothetical protein EDD17DRAFT_1600181 [Pisolithus thermaeus]|nr:hypothetical protein EDD17DRAFT_1600181 [Pisolithus thermaeus]